MLSIFEDKRATTRWLIGHGLSALTVREYDRVRDVAQFPVMMKPRTGISGHGVRIVTHDRLPGEKATAGTFFQEAIFNQTEWGVHFSALNGALLTTDCLMIRFEAHIFVRRHKKTTGRFKEVVEMECPARLLRLASDVVSRSNYHGMGCLGVKYMELQPKLLDVNPRMCGMAVNHLNGAIMTRMFRSFLEELNAQSAREGAARGVGVLHTNSLQ